MLWVVAAAACSRHQNDPAISGLTHSFQDIWMIARWHTAPVSSTWYRAEAEVAKNWVCRKTQWCYLFQSHKKEVLNEKEITNLFLPALGLAYHILQRDMKQNVLKKIVDVIAQFVWPFTWFDPFCFKFSHPLTGWYCSTTNQKLLFLYFFNFFF